MLGKITQIISYIEIYTIFFSFSIINGVTLQTDKLTEL